MNIEAEHFLEQFEAKHGDVGKLFHDAYVNRLISRSDAELNQALYSQPESFKHFYADDQKLLRQRVRAVVSEQHDESYLTASDRTLYEGFQQTPRGDLSEQQQWHFEHLEKEIHDRKNDHAHAVLEWSRKYFEQHVAGVIDEHYHHASFTGDEPELHAAKELVLGHVSEQEKDEYIAKHAHDSSRQQQQHLFLLGCMNLRLPIEWALALNQHEDVQALRSSSQKLQQQEQQPRKQLRL